MAATYDNFRARIFARPRDEYPAANILNTLCPNDLPSLPLRFFVGKPLFLRG